MIFSGDLCSDAYGHSEIIFDNAIIRNSMSDTMKTGQFKCDVKHKIVIHGQ